MDDWIHAVRTPRSASADAPVNGISCLLGFGSLRVDFLSDRDAAIVWPGPRHVTLPPALCAGIRDRLAELAAAPLLATRHQTIAEGDGFTLWLGPEVAEFDVWSGYFVTGELVTWRVAVAEYLRGAAE
jgi:hypothetical protein